LHDISEQFAGFAVSHFTHLGKPVAVKWRSMSKSWHPKYHEARRSHSRAPFTFLPWH